jgi:hypothetical protein
MSKLIDLSGQQFGKLTCLHRAKDKEEVCWTCICTCGRKVTLRRSQLRRGKDRGGTRECRYCFHERLAQSHKKDPKEIATTERYYQYKGSAKKRNLEWLVTKEEFVSLITQPCHYCKEPWSLDRRGLLHNGLDRINNSLGYISENIVPCCSTCNFAKHNMSLQDFKTWLLKIVENLPNF